MTAKNPHNPTILIVDDEASIRKMIVVALGMADFNCLEAEDGSTAYRIVVDHRPDLILLDWMLPQLSGIQLAHRLKKEEITAEIPIIMLTARSEESNKIQGLDAGADDYITKPFSTRELISRINAVLRRSSKTARATISANGLIIDPASHRVIAAGKPVDIGPTEYRLLEFFMTHQDRVYSRQQLMDRVWGSNVYIEERTVDVHIRRLRKTLAPFDYDYLIQTIRGTGYRFSRKS